MTNRLYRQDFQSFSQDSDEYFIFKYLTEEFVELVCDDEEYLAYTDKEEEYRRISIDENKEVWINLDFMEYPNYWVSNLGRLKNKDNKISNGKPEKDSGYIRLSLYNGKKSSQRLHRLIAAAFLGDKSDEFPVVDHINRIRHDNRIENLRWATKAENNVNAKKVKSRGPMRAIVQLNKDTKEFITEFPSIAEAAKILKINRTNLCLVCQTNSYPEKERKKEQQTIGGFRFVYKDIYYENNWKKSNILDIYANEDGKLKLSCGRETFGTLLDGYYTVRIKDKSYKVHRIVAHIFLDFDLNSELVIDHINGIKTDNRVCNLSVITNAENIRKAKGKPVHKINLKTGDIEATYPSAKDAQEDMKIKSSRGISAACAGLYNSSHGFGWKYANKN